MKIISLGYTCYVKNIIQKTNYNKETDIFDWMNTFEFNKIIMSLDENFDIFKHLKISHLSVDVKTNNVYFNDRYSFRLPHDKNLHESKIKYKRRHERFLNYKKDTTNNYLFIRMINKGRYGILEEDLEKNYSIEQYEKIMEYLPKKSKILILTNHKLTVDEKEKIYNKFYVVDNIISPEHIAFGKYLHHTKCILQCYNNCFNYISKNFDNFDTDIIYNFIKNENINIKN